LKVIIHCRTPSKKQSRFSEIIIMQYKRENFGLIKLTVGVLRGSQEKSAILHYRNRKNDCTTRNKHAIAIQSFISFEAAKIQLNLISTKK
jgi:hypothetical protein